jgi:nucleotide-binding universal stress UspA family protein
LQAELAALKSDYATRIGLPAEEIVQYAHEHAIDLIVMGTHGREGVMRVVLGSVAETVVRRALCPVLTVHHPEREFVMAQEPVRVRRVATA